MTREQIHKRIEEIVRDKFYPGPISGSTARLVDALIEEFALARQAADAQPSPPGGREEIARIVEQLAGAAWSACHSMFEGDPIDVGAEAACREAQTLAVDAILALRPAQPEGVSPDAMRGLLWQLASEAFHAGRRTMSEALSEIAASEYIVKALSAISGKGER